MPRDLEKASYRIDSRLYDYNLLLFLLDEGENKDIIGEKVF